MLIKLGIFLFLIGIILTALVTVPFLFIYGMHLKKKEG